MIRAFLTFGLLLFCFQQNHAQLQITAETAVPIACSGEQDGGIRILANGGNPPYRFSIDDGQSYQDNNLFFDLSAGIYDIRVRDNSGQEETLSYRLDEPQPLMASAVVTEEVACNPEQGAFVRVVNEQGGVEPYRYRFRPQDNFSSNSTGYLVPGPHVIELQDANGCRLLLDIVIDPPPVIPEVETLFECSDDGTVIVETNRPEFTYRYFLDGELNSPPNSPIFTGVLPGEHQVTLEYTDGTSPPPRTLLFDNFGSGASTPISEIGNDYCYEPQAGERFICRDEQGDLRTWLGENSYIDDGEYAVYSDINPIQGPWRVPNDHSGLEEGRFLIINIGSVAGLGGVIYAKRGVEVLPAQDITVSLWAFNLLREGTSGGDPNVVIELVRPNGQVIASESTDFIPKNRSADDWRNYQVTLNPGNNTLLDIVIRTNSTVTNGNDIVIDDLEAFQIAADCPSRVNVSVDVRYEINASVEPVYSCGPNGLSNSLEIEFQDGTDESLLLYALDSTDPDDFRLEPDFENIPPGEHYLAIANVEGCLTTLAFEIEASQAPRVVLQQTDLNEVTAQVEGGQGQFTYYFNGINQGSNNTFVLESDGEVRVRVVDQNGCEALDSINLLVCSNGNPEFFTPDGDSFNDFWSPGCQERFPDILTKIYDRYGREVYAMGPNDKPWNGMYGNSHLPTGDYWYVMQFTVDQEKREIIGHFTLHR